jgi:hypothetical protein
MHIWRERYDGDTVMIGDHTPANTSGINARYNAWASCHIDGISDLFGSDAYDAVRHSGGEPIELTIAVLKVGGKDVVGGKEAMDIVEAAMHNAPDCSALEEDMDRLVNWLENIGV